MLRFFSFVKIPVPSLEVNTVIPSKGPDLGVVVIRLFSIIFLSPLPTYGLLCFSSPLAIGPIADWGVFLSAGDPAPARDLHLGFIRIVCG